MFSSVSMETPRRGGGGGGGGEEEEEEEEEEEDDDEEKCSVQLAWKRRARERPQTLPHLSTHLLPRSAINAVLILVLNFL